MDGKSANEFADIYQAVGGVVRIPFLWGRSVLVNSARETLMERRGRWFSFTEDISWRGFSGEIHRGAGPLMVMASSGELVGSAAGFKYSQVFVGGSDFTFELVKP